MKFPFHYGKQQTNQCSSARKILPVKSPAMQTQIHSSNVNEVIRAVSNVLLLFFFFKKRFCTHKKHQTVRKVQKCTKSMKSTKKHKKIQKRK